MPCSELSRNGGRIAKLYWALEFLLVSLVAGLFGSGGISAAAADIARILFFIFIALFLLSLVFGMARRRGR